MASLWDKICEQAQIRPDHIALRFKKETLTYEKLRRASLAMAKLLCRLGLKPGEQVCFSAVSKPEMVVTYLGIQLAGGVAVFLDKNATPENMGMICNLADAAMLLTDKPMKEHAPACLSISLREMYSKALAEQGNELEIVAQEDRKLPGAFLPSAPENLAEILFTSGTTGTPKGVMLSYRSVSHIMENTVRGIGYGPDDILLLPLPLHHSFALRVLRAVLSVGGTVVLQNGFTFAKEVENNIDNYACNCMACVPTSYEIMKTQMQDALVPVLSKLRRIEFGAGSLSIRQRQELTERFPQMRIFNVWGSSESGGAIFCDVNDVTCKGQESRVGSLGRPLPDVVCVKIVDPETGKVIDSDSQHPGRMAIRGDMVMLGYWKNEEATAQTLQGGWLMTGDMAYMGEQGDIFMLGRADDLINVGGEKVSPIEVENLAGQYPGILECACIGAADESGIYGQIPVLFVVPGMNYAQDEMIRFLGTKLEHAKLPQKYIRLQELPRNRMQKIDRKKLREIYEKQDDLQLMNPVIETILSRRSIRKFRDLEIPKEVLDLILRCGYHAPSGHNLQSWRFTVLTKWADIDALQTDVLAAAKDHGVYVYGWENPAALILVSNDTRNADGCQDASCAAENMMLAAKSLGLGSVWLNAMMTLRDVEPVKTRLDAYGIPAGHTVWAAVALGYPQAQAAKLQKKEDVVHFVE